MLSLPEHAICQAVSFGDLDRVLIGEGGKNDPIVYGSLLAWVNSMPKESAKGWVAGSNPVSPTDGGRLTCENAVRRPSCLSTRIDEFDGESTD